MNAIASRAATRKVSRVSPPVTMNDVLITIIFFGTISYLMLLFITAMA